MKEIKAIVFDVGGVLIDLDMDGCRHAFKDIVGYRHTDEMLDPSHGKGLYKAIEEGRLSAEEYRKAILEDADPESTDEMVDQAMWAILDDIRPEKAALLKKLAESHDLYLLSNNNPISWPRCCQIFENAGISMSMFKGVFLSYKMKKLKPCLEIFNEIKDSIPEYDVSEMLFIDDSSRNTDMAAQAGFQTLHFPQGEDLRARLKAFGI